MTPGVRKLALTAHVTCSVGWLGAVAVFLALALAGLNARDSQLVRACYLAMSLTGWYVIVPLSFASLLTGLVQALGTPWGLFRHYWVVFKLAINVFATLLLLLHMRVATEVGNAAAERSLSGGDLQGLRMQLVVDAAGGLVALLVATALSVYKPRGLTAYGRRREPEAAAALATSARVGIPRWVYVVGIIAFVVLFLIRHLTMGGHHAHMP